MRLKYGLQLLIEGERFIVQGANRIEVFLTSMADGHVRILEREPLENLLAGLED